MTSSVSKLPKDPSREDEFYPSRYPVKCQTFLVTELDNSFRKFVKEENSSGVLRLWDRYLELHGVYGQWQHKTREVWGEGGG